MKNNIRSFRYDDTTVTILEGYRGGNLSEKFTNLVEDAFCSVERRQAELEKINAEITRRRQILSNMEKVTFELDLLERDLKAARRHFETVQRRAASIAGTFQESEM